MSLAARLRQDDLLARVILNSAHLFSSNSISLVLSFVQGILAARLLGLADYGLVVIVMAYASTINGVFSFRMSELVVRYAGEYLETGDREKASALIKAAGLTEAGVSALAFALVAFTAGLATRFITKTPGTEWMIIVYSVGLLTNFNTETSTGILQVTDKVRLRGVVNLAQSLLSATIIAAAFLLRGTRGLASLCVACRSSWAHTWQASPCLGWACSLQLRSNFGGDWGAAGQMSLLVCCHLRAS